MAPQLPVTSFDYVQDPDKGSWTFAYVKKAYTENNHTNIARLFKRATELVQAHGLTAAAFRSHSNPRDKLSMKRSEYASQLVAEFGDDIAVQGHPDFGFRLAKGVLTYQSGPGATVRIKREASSVLPPDSVSPEAAPATSNISSSATITPKPSPHASLEDFEFNCKPKQIGPRTLAYKIRVAQVTQHRLFIEPVLSDLRFERLWSLLQARRLVTDKEYEKLAYNTEGEGPFGILDDEDLQNAVQHHRVRGLQSMTIVIMTPDDFESSPLPPPAPPHHSLPSLLRSGFAPGSIGSGSLPVRSKHGTQRGPQDAPSLVTATRRSRNEPKFPEDEPERTSPRSSVKGKKRSRDENSTSDGETERISQRSSVLGNRREHSLRPSAAEDDDKDTNQPLSSPKEQIEKEPSTDEHDAEPEDEGKNSEVDVEERFRRIRDSQLCEHIHNDMWPRAAAFAKIPNPNKTTGDSKFLIPGMLKPVYHWQWLCIFVVVRFNRGALGRYGALVGDEMGLGKTYEAIGVTVFRVQLHRRWSEILKEWDDQPSDRRHCKQGASYGSTCPTNDWFCDCPCQPHSECFGIRPVGGPTLFLVPPSNVNTWYNELRAAVDLKAQGIELVIVHNVNADPEYAMTTAKANKLRTIRDETDFTASLPKSKPCERPQQYGFPSKESVYMFVLTTWQSWHGVSRTLEEKHQYTFKQKGRRKTETETIRRFQCGLAIIDESHTVKNIGRGMWRILKEMRTDRPDFHFWLMVMSGTMINSDPLDILAPMEILGDPSWSSPDHPYHHFRPSGLQSMARTINKCIEAKDKPEAKVELTQTIDRFADILPHFLIRRHENSSWFGYPLVKLNAIHRFRHETRFPAAYESAFAAIADNWQKVVLKKLKEQQDNWDSNQHHAWFLRKNPQRPTSVSSSAAFTAARLLRLCSCLPNLAVSSHTHDQKYTNSEIEASCMDKTSGRMVKGCVLDLDYPILRNTSPKLDNIARILKKHKGANALIMSSFTEMTLVVERYVREHSELRRHTRMYFGDPKKRKEAEYSFMRVTDTDGNLLVKDEPDCLIGCIGIMGTGLNLTRATVVILCEPIYDPKLYKQAPKRAHRLGQKEEVFVYLLLSNTTIEKYVDDRRESRSGFGADAFKTANATSAVFEQDVEEIV